MHISEKLAYAEASGKPIFSFEFFPPKTDQGVQNLFERMDRMHDLGPAFIDVTWGAGGRHSDRTMELVKTAQSQFGLETCMHLTCTDMGKDKIDEALQNAYNAGCTNILALRGDPPREQETWTAVEDGFRYARDLVAYIKQTYGDHFDIGVAGYPEGCDDNQDQESLTSHLKQKVDAGGTFIVTQMFYDVDSFLDWVQRVRDADISVPIVPGIMPVQTYGAFWRRAEWSKIQVPPPWVEALEPVKNDDAAVRDVGKELVSKMCQRLIESGAVHSLHFYTMNLAQSTEALLESLSLAGEGITPQRPLPWRPSLALGRRDEDVRPVFWKNKHRSYTTRTRDWDEFPNGRWGDARSPAFGHLDTYDIGLKGSNKQIIERWGEPRSIAEVADIFVRFLNGKISSLPWSDTGLSAEVDDIRAELLDLNRRGLLTINSQPAINGVKSSDPVHGWGPHGGYCYQKAYLELLVPPSLIDLIIERTSKDANMTFYAVNQAGNLRSNCLGESANAVTWGVFRGKEIVQPTIVEEISFMAWKDEAFRLGSDWAKCHPAESRTRRLLDEIVGSWFLVNIVDNDFHHAHGIFRIFQGLEAPNLDGKE